MMRKIEQYYSSNLAEVDENIIWKLVPHLQSNEKVIWLGQPRQGLINKMRLILLMIIAIVFYLLIKFVIFQSFVSGPLQTGRSVSWLAPVIYAGAVLVDIYRRKQTYYAISDSHVFIVSEFINSKVDVFNINDSVFKLKKTPDGYGTIICLPKNKVAFAQAHSTHHTMTKRIAYIHIIDALYPNLHSRLYQIPKANYVNLLLNKLALKK